MSSIATWCSLFVAACSFRPRLGHVDDGPLVVDGAADAKTTADAAPPFCDPSDATLIACYQFEGTVADGSPNHLDPNVTKNVTYGSGKVGMALVVSSTTEVDIPESSKFGVTAVTIEAWINPSQIPANGLRGGILDCDGRYGFFLYSDANVRCTAGGTVAAGPIQPNRWTHVACTADGANLSVYVDGALAQSAPASQLPPLGSQTGITLGGNNPPNGGDPLDGSLDQVRLYSVARTAREICLDAARSPCA
jgi:hypothetical protein